jgi:prepilin-type N-terminal cleavage/methylation domain-containing protein
LTTAGAPSRQDHPLPFQGEARVRIRASRIAPRAGFTLVELMMSLIIIGMLASLLGVAVTFAINAAKNAATKVDIANLDTALQSYKNNYGSEYPACMAIPAVQNANSNSAPSPSRYDLFNRSLRKRFSRLTNNYQAQWLNNTNDVAWYLANNWSVRDLSNPSGAPIPLDLDNMDAAESLVFWLAGPPAAYDTTTSQFTTNNVLWGFSANPTNPFAVKGSRLPSLYEFDETRLTDVDGDGWPEYTPKGSTNKITGVPPFVYFEPNSYSYKFLNQTMVATYPGFFPIVLGSPYGAPQGSLSTLVTGSMPTNPHTVYQTPARSGHKTTDMAAEWGFAVPYATTQQLLPWSPKKFQLIAGGLDYEYGGSQYEIAGAGRQYVPVVPQTANQGSQVYVTTGDNDNLTNFIDSKIEDNVPQ